MAAHRPPDPPPDPEPKPSPKKLNPTHENSPPKKTITFETANILPSSFKTSQIDLDTSSPPKNIPFTFKTTTQTVSIKQSPPRNVPDLLRNQPQNSFRAPRESFDASSPPPAPAKEAPNKVNSTPPTTETPPLNGPKKEVVSPPRRESLPRKKEYPSPPKRQDSIKTEFPPPQKDSKEISSPPVAAFKINRMDSKGDESSSNTKTLNKDAAVIKQVPIKNDKLPPIANNQVEKAAAEIQTEDLEAKKDKVVVSEESNGVGDKIKKFEKAAEDASANIGRMSRTGSVRGRSRTERLGSDSKEDLPPPATPFKDNVHFDLSTATASPVEKAVSILERQQSLTKNSNSNLKWQKSDSSEVEKVKPEPQKIIKPEFKPIVSPGEVTIRSPSLGTKLPDQFPSHGTAFRNVASPDPARATVHKSNDDVTAQNNLKACKLKNKEKYSVSKGSSYFTRGSEEIWLVKKKDIEEIEERVLDSFRRAGGNICMRSESMRPSSDSGQGVSFTHATMGRTKRQMYARSESLDPQWAGARSQTLKRQSSVACTCGHDKKTRAKSAGASDTNARPRSRSHGDDNNQAHVLDKYETLV